MKRLIAYLRARPKVSIAAVVVAVFVAASIWNAVGPKSLIATPWSGGVTSLGIGERVAVGSAGIAYSGSMMAIAPSAVDIGMMPVPAPTAGKTAADVEQKIVKNGYLQLAVDKVADAADRISQLVTARGGFVQSSSVSERGDGTYRGDVSVRVPVEKFEETMAEIKKLATLVKSETATGQDVTEQYSDLQAQLRNAQAQEQTYLAILRQAKTVSDTLQVQQQLGVIRGQIESLQGRIQYLTNTTSYSTISISLEEEPSVRAPTKEFRFWTIVKEATQALVASVQGIIAALIWALIVWGGILIPLGLIIWLVARLWKRHASKSTKRR